MTVKRWIVVLKDGGIVGVGISQKRFELKRVIFFEDGSEAPRMDWRAVWREEGSRYAKLPDGNFATILRRGPDKENIEGYTHKRVRRYTKCMERHEYGKKGSNP